MPSNLIPYYPTDCDQLKNESSSIEHETCNEK